MEYLYIVLLVIVVIIIFNNLKLDTKGLNGNHLDNNRNGNGSILPPYPENDREFIPENGFVKPQHKLLNLLNNISKASKIKLNKVVERESFTQHTMDPEYRSKLTKLLKIIISSINNLSETDFYIKGVENLYVLRDEGDNFRFIVDTFMYDIKNYYTIRLNADIVLYKGEAFINYLDIDESAINNILNKYDVKYQAQGILSKYNMFTNDAESLLNEYYENNYKVIGVNNTSLEYETNDLSSLFSLNQLSHNYLPAGTPNQDASYFCKKNKQTFDSKGVKFINEFNSDCIAHNNAGRKYPNEPYTSSSSIKTRVDFNAYDWLKNPQNGNIIYSSGFNL